MKKNNASAEKRDLPDKAYVTVTEAAMWIVVGDCRDDEFLKRVRAQEEIDRRILWRALRWCHQKMFVAAGNQECELLGQRCDHWGKPLGAHAPIPYIYFAGPVEHRITRVPFIDSTAPWIGQLVPLVRPGGLDRDASRQIYFRPVVRTADARNLEQKLKEGASQSRKLGAPRKIDDVVKVIEDLASSDPQRVNRSTPVKVLAHLVRASGDPLVGDVSNETVRRAKKKARLPPP